MPTLLVAIGLILLILEIFTISTFLIWVSFGFFAAAFVALFTNNLIVISLSGLIIFVVSIYLFRGKYLGKMMSKNSIKTSYEEILDKNGVVIKQFLGDSEEVGIVKVNGMEWSAKSTQKILFEKNQIVKIKKIEGVKIIVEKD